MSLANAAENAPFDKAVIKVMKEDSHQRIATHSLPPSPSLNWATNEPAKQYLTSHGAGI